MPFKCHMSVPNIGFVTQTSSGVVPVRPAFGRRRMRGYHESVAYTLPSASIVMSLQKPLIPSGAFGSATAGEGHAQLPVGAPVFRLKALSATGAVPERE